MKTSRERVEYLAYRRHWEQAREIRDFLEDVGRAAWARMYEVGGDDGPEEYTRVTSALRVIRAEMNAVVHGPVTP